MKVTNLEFDGLTWLDLSLAHLSRTQGIPTPFSKCRAVTCFKQILSGDEVLFVIRQDGMAINVCLSLRYDQVLFDLYGRTARNMLCRNELIS